MGTMETAGRAGKSEMWLLLSLSLSLMALEISLFSLLDCRCLSLSLSLGPGFLSLPLYLFTLDSFFPREIKRIFRKMKNAKGYKSNSVKKDHKTELELLS